MTESNNPPDEGGPEQTPWQQQPPPPPPYPPQQGYPGYPQQGGYGGPPPPKIQNWLIPSIVSTVLCCLPAGVVGIIYASQVNGKLASGDIAGAQKAANNARLWTIISVVVGLVAIVVYFVAVAGTQNQ
jgi:hypothetical protein